MHEVHGVASEGGSKVRTGVSCIKGGGRRETALLGRGDSSVQSHEVHLAATGGPDGGKKHLKKVRHAQTLYATAVWRS